MDWRASLTQAVLISHPHTHTHTHTQEGRQSTQHGLAAVLGSVSVLEGEGRTSREDLSNVLNAEIRTRSVQGVKGQSRGSNWDSVSSATVMSTTIFETSFASTKDL